MLAMADNKYHKRLEEQKTVEMLPGIFRTTLAYNDQLMLCHFYMKKGLRSLFTAMKLFKTDT